MHRRVFLRQAAGTLLALPALANCARKAEVDIEPSVFRATFGSCANQNHSQPIWKSVAETDPDCFIFLGDNIYGDTENMELLRRKYSQFGFTPEFRSFRSRYPVLATWDDHDYGNNDSGLEYPKKEESKKIFLDFFEEPVASLRWKRNGIYTSYFIGEHPRQVQILLLDLRWFRSALNKDEAGRYIPDPSPVATLLGKEQWSWLEKELSKPADFRILGSSIQFAAEGHYWEKWENFPFEKMKLLRLIDELKIKNLVVISGDMHYGEISKQQTPAGAEIFDITSSGLTHSEPSDGIENQNRLMVYDSGLNFGFLEIDWTKKMVTVGVKDDLAKTRISLDLELRH